MDVDLKRAVRRVAAALLPRRKSGAVRSTVSDAEVLDVVGRTSEIMTDVSTDRRSAVLALALELLWPQPTIDGLKLIRVVESRLKVVESTFKPEAIVDARRAAYLAARAVLAAWNVDDGRIPRRRPRTGRKVDPRGPAEAMLRTWGMELEQIAEFTDPLPEGAGRVKKRISRYRKREKETIRRCLKREGTKLHVRRVTPSALVYRAAFTEEEGTKPVEIRPVTLIPGVDKSQASMEVPSDERKRRKPTT